MDNKINLYKVVRDVKCIKCNSNGAIQSYGTYDETKEKMSHTLGFGGTIPYQCLNCGNAGLINFGGLEGYKKAFIRLPKKDDGEGQERYG